MPAKEANLKIPQVMTKRLVTSSFCFISQTVIKFYEGRLNWYDNNEGGD